MDALLYLMRHGAAEDSAPTGRDADRRLTLAGRATVEKVALAVQRSRGRQVGHIIASPFVRARQTAEIMRAVLGPRVDIEIDETLTPDGSAYDLAARLCSASLDTLLVGHQPNIEMVARALAIRPLTMGPQAAPSRPPSMGPQAAPSPNAQGAPASGPFSHAGAFTRLPAGFRTATVVGFQVEGRPPPYALALTIDPSVLPDV